VQQEIETLDSDKKEDMEDLRDNSNSLLKNNLMLDQCGGNVEEMEFDNYFLYANIEESRGNALGFYRGRLVRNFHSASNTWWHLSSVTSE
jgi:hypothetical protein